MLEEGKDVVLKLIFAILGAMFVIMTSIGGFTATHLLNQSDDIVKRLGNIESSMAAQDVYRSDTERRLEIIESRIDHLNK